MKLNYLKSIFLCSCLFAGISASAQDAQVDDVYYNFDGNVAEVTYSSSPNYKGDVVIPSTVEYEGTSYEVTAIGRAAFRDCKYLTSVVIPSSVTKIGNNAFKGCTSLTTVNIPEGITTFDTSVFQGCSSLASINIPSSVTTIGSHAFHGCKSLTEVTIPATVTNLNDYAFYGCSGLTSFVIPAGITAVSNSLLSGCKGLTSVTIPATVTSVGSNAFYGCSNLEEISLPAAVMSIGNDAFALCRSLKKFSIPAGVQSIEAQTFYGCSNLTSVAIPESVTSIDSEAFAFCISLSEFTVPGSVSSVGSYLFYNCINLKSVAFVGPVKYLPIYAFAYCTNLSTIEFPEDLRCIGDEAFKESKWLNDQPDDALLYAGSVLYAFKGTMPEGFEMVIEDGTLSVNEFAFNGNENITSITIPESMDTICAYAFGDCKGLQIIRCLSAAPPKADPFAFNGVSAKAVLLVVPNYAKDNYLADPVWSNFMIKEESEVSSVKPDFGIIDDEDIEDGIISAKNEAQTISEAYDLNGRRLKAIQQGVNVIRMSDGTTRKVIVK